MSPRGVRSGLRTRWRLAALLLPLMLVTGWLARAPRLAADAVGCSRVNNSYPGASSTCVPSPNQACYDCEYSVGGGYQVCAENPDGTVKICQTVEELPGRHAANQTH